MPYDLYLEVLQLDPYSLPIIQDCATKHTSMNTQRSSARLFLPLVVWLFVFLPACFTNNPYRSNEAGKNIYYDTFTSEPKHLDPARAYSEDEYEIMNPIYEPVVQ